MKNKPSKTHVKISNNLLVFTCMVEVLFSSYEKCKLAIGFDSNLLNKLFNMKSQLERILKKNVQFIDQTGDSSIHVYHLITEIFEKIFEATDKGDTDYLVTFLDLVKSFHLNEITAVNESEYDAKMKRLESLENYIKENNIVV